MKIGTRGSDLALWQARHVRALLQEVCGVDSELVIIHTSGDKDLETPFVGMTGKGFFTIRGKVDLATPEGGEEVYSGATRFVRWESRRIPGVASALLKLTTDGGRTWRTIGTVRGNPGSYAWSVPPTEEPLEGCRVRVQLRNAGGAVLASDDGAGLFTILPLP